MLNFWKVPPLTPQPARQIFARKKPVDPESKVIAQSENIGDIDGFYLHTNTQSSGLQEGIISVIIYIYK